MEATAYWTVAPRRGELRPEELVEPRPGEVLIRTIASGVSRGTELLVHRHAVPESVRDLMRAPFQVGGLPDPVKYGYLSVGRVERGPDNLRGRRVFCLHPHQDRYVVPVDWVTPVPDDVPSERAVLAGTVETAVNALWDGGPRIGDRVAVVGAGMVGMTVAALLRTFPLERLEVVETAVDARRTEAASRLGLTLVTPEQASDGCDLVVHSSATGAGLATALRLLGSEGEVIELSWYGDALPGVPLGQDFHARRLSIRGSQVGTISPARAARRTHRERLELSLRLLGDAGFDVLAAPPVGFSDLPRVIADLDRGRGTPFCQVIRYDSEES